jgi:hypothetical protein
MTINVGLGTGSKAQQFAQMMAIAGLQEKLLAGGKANLIDDTCVFNTFTEISKLLGHKNADKFINDPQAKDPQTGQLLHPAPPPQADPKTQAIQAKAQADVQHQTIKTQSETEIATLKAELDAKLAVLVQGLGHSRRQGADAQLHGGAVWHELGHPARDLLLQCGGLGVGHLDQAGVAVHQPVNVFCIHPAVALHQWQRGVQESDHHTGSFDQCAREVRDDPQRVTARG